MNLPRSSFAIYERDLRIQSSSNVFRTRPCVQISSRQNRSTVREETPATAAAAAAAALRPETRRWRFFIRKGKSGRESRPDLFARNNLLFKANTRCACIVVVLCPRPRLSPIGTRSCEKSEKKIGREKIISESRRFLHARWLADFLRACARFA